MKNRKKTSSTFIGKIYRNPKYSGKHIIIMDDKVYATKTGQAKSDLLKKLLKKHPKKTPTITYIPKEDTLILFYL